MKYVIYMSSVVGFTDAQFKAQMKAVSAGGCFDYDAGKELGTCFQNGSLNHAGAAAEYVRTGREEELL